MLARVLVVIGAVAVLSFIVANPNLLQDAVNLIKDATNGLKGAFR